MGWWPFSRNEQNTLNTLKIPIVLVPGVMGSRLNLGDVDWDPDWGLLVMWRKWSRMTADDKRKHLDWENSLGTVIGEGEKRGWATVAKEFYRKLLEYLDAEDRFENARCPAYAVGYDWRQSNWDSAGYLKQRAEDVLRKEKADELIIVTHSMGGMVARCAFSRFPMFAAQVRGVIHVVQPVAGAPVLYRRLFTGATPEFDGGSTKEKVFNSIVGNNPSDSAWVVSALRGPMELNPTRHYRDVDKSPDRKPNPWLYRRVGTSDAPHFDPTVDTEVAGEPDEYFQSDDSPPGLFCMGLHRPETKEPLLDLAKKASEFHRSLKLHRHRNTWTIYSNGRTTDMAIRFQGGGLRIEGLPVAAAQPSVVPQRRAGGDGTVPLPSAAALFPDQVGIAATKENLRDPKNRQFEVSGADHSEVFASDAVKEAIAALIQEMLRSKNDGVVQLDFSDEAAERPSERK